MTAPTPTAAATTAAGCAAPDQAAPIPASVDLQKETIITGTVVTADGEAVAGGYVRLLDATGEFTAEVVTSATGDFRFFAAPGEWTLSVLHRDGKARSNVHAPQPGLVEASLTLS